MADDTVKRGAKQLEPFKWKPGQSGNPKGRPKGARSLLADAFLQDMLDHWKEHGKQAIDDAMKQNPAGYLSVMAKLMPKEVKVDHDLGDQLQQFLTSIQQEEPRTIEGQVIDGQAIEDKPETLQ